MDNNPDRGSSRKEQQMSAITRTTSVAVRVTLGLALAAWAAEPPSIPNRGAAEVQGAVQIVVGKRATALERYAAKELQRHLHAVFGVYGALADDGAPLDRPSCLVGRPESNARIAALVENETIHLAQGDPGAGGYVLKTVRVANQPVLVVAGGDEVGTLHGVYGLLDDHYGVGFYFSGDVLPPKRERFEWVAVDERKKPAYAVRGITPWNAYPQGFDYYAWEDWTFVIDQMAKMRLNLLVIHNYTGYGGNDVFHNFCHQGFWSRVRSHTIARGGHWIKPAGNVHQLPFGAADLFDDYDYAGFHALHNESLTNEQVFRKGSTLFQRLLDHARRRGVQVALIVDINTLANGYPRGLDPSSLEVIDARLDQLLNDYPHLDYLLFCARGQMKDSPAGEKWIKAFVHAFERIKRERPGMRLGAMDWGGISPKVLAHLPEDIIHAPITGAKDLGKRQAWSCFWSEYDETCYEAYPLDRLPRYPGRGQSPSTGLFCLTWRLAGPVGPTLSYLSKMPWDNEGRYSPKGAIQRDYARRCYGPEAADEIAPLLGDREQRAALLAAIAKRLPTTGDPDRRARLEHLRASVASGCDLDEIAKVCKLYSSRSSRVPGSPFQIAWEDLPGPFRGWYKNLIDQVVDVSTLGNLVCACRDSHVKMIEELQAKQAIKAPHLEARGTRQGAVLSWRNVEPRATGWNVYRNGTKLNDAPLPVATTSFTDLADGEYNYAVTAVAAEGRESPRSIPATCLAGKGDRQPPHVVLLSPPSAVAVGQPVPIKVRVVDGRAHELVTCTLFYRKLGETKWTPLPMQRRVKAVFADLIPAAAGGDTGLEYYVEVTDGDNRTVVPRGAPGRPFTAIRYDSADQQAPAAPAGFRSKDQGLTWEANRDDAFWYRIYRGRTRDFAVGPSSFLTYVAKGTTVFREGDVSNVKEKEPLRDFDGSSMEGKSYYYRITAMDRCGSESPATGVVELRY